MMLWITSTCRTKILISLILVLNRAAFNGADPLFQCYYCRGIDISDCLDGSSVTVTTCPKGVHSCVMSYRKVGPTEQIARGCRSSPSPRLNLPAIFCSKNRAHPARLLTVACACQTSLCNRNSSSQLLLVPEQLEVNWGE